MADDFTSGSIGPVPTVIVVRYRTGEQASFPDTGWRIERIGPEAEPFLIIGRGVPRTFVPLANVLAFDVTYEIDQQPHN